jgi:hypothetical protein
MRIALLIGGLVVVTVVIICSVCALYIRDGDSQAMTSIVGSINSLQSVTEQKQWVEPAVSSTSSPVHAAGPISEPLAPPRNAPPPSPLSLGYVEKISKNYRELLSQRDAAHSDLASLAKADPDTTDIFNAKVKKAALPLVLIAFIQALDDPFYGPLLRECLSDGKTWQELKRLFTFSAKQLKVDTDFTVVETAPELVAAARSSQGEFEEKYARFISVLGIDERTRRIIESSAGSEFLTGMLPHYMRIHGYEFDQVSASFTPRY